MASKRRLRRKVCERKQRFETAEEARRYIGWLRRIERLRPNTRVYQCRFCRGWHFGRAPGRLCKWVAHDGV